MIIIINKRIFLQDVKFLHELDNLKIKTQYVKITVLDWQENPLQEVQGKIINGSVNLDGSSSMRRTASLSIEASEKENNLSNIDNLFSLNKKCRLELGIVNTVPNYNFATEKNNVVVYQTINYKEKYGEVIWFPLGLYIMFNPSIVHGLDGVTISMQLKDKMCLLNGDLGGQIHSGVDFSYQEEKTDGSYFELEKKPSLIYNIIRQLVHHWGNEELNKIIISEVPLKIKMAMKWIGEDPIYLYKDSTGWHLNETRPTGVLNVQEVKKNEDIGYTYQDFTYPGELTCNAGDTVTSVLDKIINILGNYEYFYDVDGNFIFREKQNYLNMSNVAFWLKEKNKEEQDEQEQEDSYSDELPLDTYSANTYQLSKAVYQISDNNYTININNSLNFNNIKNDFVVWGVYKTATDKTVGCRFHLAIDKKPNLNIHKRIVLYEDDNSIIRGIHLTEAVKKQISGNLKTITIGGIEYPVIEYNISHKSRDWREEIYYQMLESEAIGTEENTELNNSYFQYYAELKEQFPKIFDLTTADDPIDGHLVAKGYTKTFMENPEQILYFLDFINENTGLGAFSVNNIGRRSYIIEDNNEGINCVFEPAIPDIVYIDTTKYDTMDQVKNVQQALNNYGQQWIQVESDYYDQMATGGKLNSCYEKIKDLLYQYTHVNNSISISTIPIYHLEPGSRITVEDKQSGTHDDFIIQSISLPLDISSTMSINAYKALQKI